MSPDNTSAPSPQTPTGSESNENSNATTHHTNERKEVKPKSSVRLTAGKVLESISSTINDHIILARYGTILTVTALVGYGVYASPLTFRYRNVAEIPRNAFLKRKTLRGRIVEVLRPNSGTGKDEQQEPIRILVHHLSPIQRFMFISNFLKTKISNDKNNLIQIELAGVISTCTAKQRSNDLLHTLTTSYTPVTFQLLARHQNEPLSLCKVKYGYFPRRDLSSTLISNGQAMVPSSIFPPCISDSSTLLQHIKSDVAYMDHLSELEYETFKNRKGIWDDDDLRQTRRDLILEEEYDSMPFWKRLWRRLRRLY